MTTYCAPCLADLALVREAVTTVSGTAACVAHAVLLTHTGDNAQRRLTRLSDLRAMAEEKLPTASDEDRPKIELLVQEYALAGAMDMTVPLKELAGDRAPRPPKSRRDRGRDRGPRPEGDRGPRPEGDRGPRPEGDRGPRPGGERGPRPDSPASVPDVSDASGAPAPAPADSSSAPAPGPDLSDASGAPAPAPADSSSAPAEAPPAAPAEAPPAASADVATAAPEPSGRNEEASAPPAPSGDSAGGE